MSTGWTGYAARAEMVLERMLTHYGLSHPSEIDSWILRPQRAQTCDLRDPAGVWEAAHQLRTPVGRVHFRVQASASRHLGTHPMVVSLRRVQEELDLGMEITHPLESDTRDHLGRFSDVVSIRKVPSAGVALSARYLPFHQDGLGTAGSVRFISMCLDQAPECGGDQSYVNVLAHGIRLANNHWRRFVEATMTDALTIARVAGSQQIAVTGPMFYVDDTGLPASHFRIGGGEYFVRPNALISTWLADFNRCLGDFAVTEPMKTGDCLLLDNLSMAHSRANFVESRVGRRLARKWYAISDARSSVRGESTLRLSREVYAHDDRT